ncbi:adenosine kinase [Halieaceae bacterium IMCC14734]|uniref:Adenosine kinase n=1 Tax=Candidatus Litorirhabdus singularis TaxID=2518993 RepID=A0ABT3TM08_9GAMM|nr:adenosine kinase [Candidatus Litorirhabdus singularis]MCX2983333.1 adenosine kinase [Candidatus Litorirhabdus singularis]
MKKYTVYGVGNALVDTEIQVEDQELAAMGVEKGLMTLVDETRQQELSDHLEGHMVAAKRASGGSAANTVIATTRFGGSAFYSCKVANDDNGDFYLQDLEAAGVDHNWEHDRETGTTGRCLVLISPDAERSMNSFLGISGTMATSELNADAIRDSEYLYLEGYLVTSDTARAAAVEARNIAETAGVKTVLSFSDPGMVEFFRDGMQEMLGEQKLHLLFCNEQEAMTWAGSDDLEATAEALKQVADSFVITLGARGALIHDGEASFEIAGHSVTAVDSNGAGDMFAGAFLYALGAGHDHRVAGNFASLAAARVVSRFGPRLSAVEHDELIGEFFS